MTELDTSWLDAATRSLARCDLLGSISSMDGAVCRTYLTPEHASCNITVQQWMKQAGMETWVDAAGNCCGSYRAAEEDAPVVMLGSHLDTVPNAGKYDGILGVISAIELVDKLNREGKRLPFTIDIVGFGDEEGVRFGATLLGSRAVAGTWDEHWMPRKDEAGITMQEALDHFHGVNMDIQSASRANDNILAYLELHIEQGPVLVQQNLPVGIVSSIAGARRFQFDVVGMAGHAGTVPMNMRLDALTATAKMITHIEHVASRNNIVATVGKLEVAPGSVNVIPGNCMFTLDIRSGRDESRDVALTQIMSGIDEIAEENRVSYTSNEIHNASAVKCASWIQRCIETAIDDTGMASISLVSGAGHDAMALADVCDIGMIFLRCDRGISHHPAEAVSHEDVAHGIRTFADTLDNIAEHYLSNA